MKKPLIISGHEMIWLLRPFNSEKIGMKIDLTAFR